MQSAASSAAAGREASVTAAASAPAPRAARRRDRSDARCVVDRAALRPRRPNSHGPSSASSAGTSVTHTSVTTSADSASAGPNTRKNCISPASSDIAPPATSSPAISTSGAIRAVAARAAAIRDVARGEAPPRLGHEEHRVVGDEPEQQHHQHRLDLARRGHVRPLAAPRQHAHGDHVREPGARERDERRAERPEVQRDDDQDHGDRRHLDPRQHVVDRLELREPRRPGARHTARRAVAPAAAASPRSAAPPRCARRG